MRNQGKRKRITALLLVFLLMFLVGAAFAFAPGQLTIGGTVNLDPDYVIWNTATTSVTSPAAITTTTITSTAEIVDARGRTDQHINWTINFGSPGVARLDVTALNEHETLPAAVVLNVANSGPYTNALFGISIGGNFSTGLPETIAPGAIGLNRYVTVEWDGTVPIGFSPSADNPAFEFTITFDYTAAP